MAGKFDSILDCAICFEPMVDPLALPCLHSFCGECVIKLKQGDLIRCPMDNKVFKFTELQKDFRFEHFRERLDKHAKSNEQAKSTNVLCQSCDEHEATSS